MASGRPRSMRVGAKPDVHVARRGPATALVEPISTETKRNSSSPATDALHASRPWPERRVYKRETPVKSACTQCRRRKTRCSGQRPACQGCLSRGTQCLWNVCDGLSTISEFKHKLQEVESHLDTLKILIESLRLGTDHTATLLLAKLRLGIAAEDLVRPVRPELCETHDGHLVDAVGYQSFH